MKILSKIIRLRRSKMMNLSLKRYISLLIKNLKHRERWKRGNHCTKALSYSLQIINKSPKKTIGSPWWTSTPKSILLKAPKTPSKFLSQQSRFSINFEPSVEKSQRMTPISLWTTTIWQFSIGLQPICSSRQPLTIPFNKSQRKEKINHQKTPTQAPYTRT